MTREFKEKLGEGGYGNVYKEKLQSGWDVEVKILHEPKAGGQDFMNEVATIRRIHHVNVVELVGYYVEGTKRALVYAFMPNESLDKYISTSQEASPLLSWPRKYDIILRVVRVARGTIGYVAPKLISTNIGAISNKAAIYSFGMLLMEMLDLKKNEVANEENFS